VFICAPPLRFEKRRTSMGRLVCLSLKIPKISDELSMTSLSLKVRDQVTFRGCCCRDFC
jgi:hypothetical protein